MLNTQASQILLEETFLKKVRKLKLSFQLKEDLYEARKRSIPKNVKRI